MTTATQTNIIVKDTFDKTTGKFQFRMYYKIGAGWVAYADGASKLSDETLFRWVDRAAQSVKDNELLDVIDTSKPTTALPTGWIRLDPPVILANGMKGYGRPR